MNVMQKLIRYVSDKDYRFYVNARMGMYNNMPDKEYISKMFKFRMGYELNLDDPKTCNEKLQWLKLFDRNPKYTKLVDKYLVKQYVQETIGKEYVVPLLGVWENAKDIDFNKLPNQFVLKCNHDSQGVIVCEDKSKLDIQDTIKKLNKKLNKNYYLLYREWPYKDVKPKIIAEKYLENKKTKGINDYKFYCFDGKVKIMMIATERLTGNTKMDYFDKNFNNIDLKWGGELSNDLPEKPKSFELMIKLAEQLSKGIKMVRIDFYEIDERPYFGEFTFFDGSGYTKIEPNIWDKKLGSWIDLSDIKNNK